MCVGTKWLTRYQHTLNVFSSKNHLEILTDNPNGLTGSHITLYERDIFSYYEKVNFMFNLSKKYNERITYIDTDWLEGYNTNIKYDDITLYSYEIFNLSDENILTKWFTEKEHYFRKSLLSNILVNTNIDFYIPEALISIPQLNNIDNIQFDLKIIQPIIENWYDLKNKTPRFRRYIKNGIGYAEGWGVSAVCKKYNIPIDKVDWKKQTLL
jgi:hypothetical protein